MANIPLAERLPFASLLIQQGKSLAYVRDQLGHHSIQITLDTYSHLIPGASREVVDKLDDAENATRREEGEAYLSLKP